MRMKGVEGDELKVRACVSLGMVQVEVGIYAWLLRSISLTANSDGGVRWNF